MILSEKFQEALTLSARLHAGQLRKGSAVPYVSHLMAVSALVLEFGGSEECAIAALLHDAVEDAGGEPVLLEIREQFGEQVADIVEACSDCMGSPKPPWRLRKEAYIERIRRASAEVRLVSGCDKLHNARSIVRDLRNPEVGHRVWDRFSASREQTLWYYEELLAAYSAWGDTTLTQELAEAVAEMRRRGEGQEQ